MSADGSVVVGTAYNANGSLRAFRWTAAGCTAYNGDADGYGCVDDADLLAVLFAFGGSGQNLGRVDVNCDDTDLLQVLSNFGQGC